MKWRAVTQRDGTPSKYAITNGTYNICKVVVGGVEWFEVWRLSDKRMLARFRTAEEARGFADGPRTLRKKD